MVDIKKEGKVYVITIYPKDLKDEALKKLNNKGLIDENLGVSGLVTFCINEECEGGD